jgi:uncharacterized membrane protein
MVMIQILWLSWLLAGRGHATPRTRTCIGAIRGLMSLAMAILFLFLNRGKSPWEMLLYCLLGFVSLVMVVLFALSAEEEQGKLASPPKPRNRYNLFFYINKDDPRVVVPKGALGVGITFNFAHWEAWIFILLLAGMPFILMLIDKFF